MLGCRPAVASYIFPAVALLSLTPCFSGVFGERRGAVNRFNGLRPLARWNQGERTKPLKRLTAPRFAPNTPLKQGVNERAPRLEISKMRTFALFHERSAVALWERAR